MHHVVLNKSDFGDFIKRLVYYYKVVAPVDKGYNNFSFQEIVSAEEIALKYIPTILPPKKYFLPQIEKIIEYNMKKEIFDGVMEYEKLVLFGVHTCDLAGIQAMNMVFSGKPIDLNYLFRKSKIAIIGLECNDYCDEYASCGLMHNIFPNGGYDLFFTELESVFFVHINTEIGDDLVEKTHLFQEAKPEHLELVGSLRIKKKEIFRNETDVEHHDLKGLFDRAFECTTWDDLDKKCVSCGNCTNVCPTCYCFDVRDDINLDFNTGERKRIWDSCQSEMFAEVAGGESFREKRGDRQRHRYMRKFKYPVQRYSRYFCTGCGRCSRTCMADINLKETIDSIAKELA